MMTETNTPWKNTAYTAYVESDAWANASASRLHVLLTLERDGTVSAIALNLPGVASQGDTMAEAIENVKEAALAAIEEYNSTAEEIPWRDSTSQEIPLGSTAKWVILNG